MRAQIGDWLVVKSATTGRAERRGLITEVHSADGAAPYVVRWLDNEHEAVVFPGPDAVIVTPQEQRAADERMASRVQSVQQSIRNVALAPQKEPGQ